MFIVLAFRQVFFSSIPLQLDRLKRYLLLLKQTFLLILPGDPIVGTCVMLTFDFASVDFYSHIFPFLHEHGIPAVVGIAWRYVPPNTALTLPLTYRLATSEVLAFQDEIFSKHMPFCCQQELSHMTTSPYIQFASSGFALRNLQNSPPYLITEVFLSKHYLETMLEKKPLAFVFPFGKSDRASQDFVAQHYSYSFVLGNTINLKSKTHNIYRLDMQPSYYTLPNSYSSRHLKNWLLMKFRQWRVRSHLKLLKED
ncbi:polysaccharide deacetylase family protein [Candidatus Chlamydia sanziniae]|uniref:NodB homology domain-containing protein n=1 Tax=Candidatus Chlamydia sanziniae TaxID=1806891 RepID=A0A1A9HWM5_9CHLA|nr:polysaccharide deacetylase family protein [Candidatus Chlamydia sanziniae]ANH78492.1 hypothetical protein Cs308_0321 [Candidatus Chlamydia sanziniae]